MKKNSIIAALLILLVSTNASLAYRKIKCFILQPPEQILEGVKRIAILNFEGRYADIAADALVADLLNDKRGIQDIKGGLFSSTKEGCSHQVWATTRIYDIVERSQLVRILDEQKIGLSGMINEQQAAELGKILGVNAIIIGSVSSEDSDTWTKEKRTVYRKKEEGGNYTIVVEVLTRRVRATVKMKVVSVETAQILTSKESTREYKESKDKEYINQLSIVESARQSCIKSACLELANFISPYFELVEMEFDKIKEKSIKDMAEKAAELAESGDLNKAYTMYYAMYQEDPYNPCVSYNLGILNEAVGNFEEAKDMYEAALMLKSDEKEYQKASLRISKSLVFTEAMNKIDIEIVKYEWDISEKALNAATAQKVNVKGKSSMRYEIYESPDKSSKVITKVPGGIELEVIAVEGDWYKVKLLGNKEGYIHKDFVKD